MPTPDGVMYQTPFNEDEEPSEETAVTPHNSGHSSETVTNASPSSPNEEVWESGSEGEDDQLPLIWNGYTRSDIHALLRQAEEYARHGNSSRADVLFQNALKGYQHLVGPVHEETSKVAFTLATFYFEQGHLAKAYTLLEKNTQTHIKNLGIEHHRTQQHVADIGRLLHSWGKKDDADAFLDRAREAEEAIRAESRFDTNVHQKPWKAFIVAPPKAAPQLVIPGEIEGNRVQLMKTIEECEQNMNRLVAQSRKAWGELLKFPGEEKPRWY
jgi:tetratricopeptide (TPR) repeat protein